MWNTSQTATTMSLDGLWITVGYLHLATETFFAGNFLDVDATKLKGLKAKKRTQECQKGTQNCMNKHV